MEEIVVFGNGKIAEVILRVIEDHQLFSIAAFCSDDDFVDSEEFHGYPLVRASELKDRFPPKDFKMFVALGYQDINRLREQKVSWSVQQGYELVSVIHPKASIYSDLEFGENCFIMDNVHIHPHVRIGSNTFIWSGAIVGHHTSIGNNCWLTSGANVSGVVTMGDNVFVAINGTIANEVSIGNHAFVGANVLVTKSVEPMQVLISESSKPIRLNVDQFLKFSSFS